jgi:hypothetical protein
MNLLLYATGPRGTGKQLQKVIEGLFPENKTEIYRTIDGLSDRLRRPRYDLAVAVLLAASKQDLLDLLSIRDLLDDLRVILLLPNREKDTITKGHTLRPRFLTYADSDFLDVAAVLSKMVRNTHPDKKRG